MPIEALAELPDPDHYNVANIGAALSETDILAPHGDALAVLAATIASALDWMGFFDRHTPALIVQRQPMTRRLAVTWQDGHCWHTRYVPLQNPEPI